MLAKVQFFRASVHFMSEVKKARLRFGLLGCPKQRKYFFIFWGNINLNLFVSLTWPLN